jgi:hypothetical protein
MIARANPGRASDRDDILHRMKLQIWAAVGLLAASCQRSAERQPLQPPRSPPAESAPTATAEGSSSPPPAGPTARPPRVPQVPPSGSAGDDLPHRRQDLAWLGSMRNCVPSQARNEEIELALDSYGGHLVLCAQALTRRDVSVYFDHVSYACWDVDPATAAVSLRPDLGRSYFQCQDGACPPGDTDEVISYDGTELLVHSEDKHELAIFTRPGRKPVRSFAFAEPVDPRGLTLLGHTILVEGHGISVLDDHGTSLAKLEGIEVHVVDEGHVLVVRDIDERQGTLYDLASRKAVPIRLAAPYVAGAVRHAGALFAVDSNARKLVTLGPKTFQPGRALPLPICP